MKESIIDGQSLKKKFGLSSSHLASGLFAYFSLFELS
jgi:hypothetical protein